MRRHSPDDAPEYGGPPNRSVAALTHYRECVSARSTYENYLADSVLLLREMLERAQHDAKRETAEDAEFRSGEAFGLMEALSLLHQQAVAFGLPLEKLNLSGYNPEEQWAKGEVPPTEP